MSQRHPPEGRAGARSCSCCWVSQRASPTCPGRHWWGRRQLRAKCSQTGQREHRVCHRRRMQGLDLVPTPLQPLIPVLCPQSPASAFVHRELGTGSDSLCCSMSRVSVPDKGPPGTRDKFFLGSGSAFPQSSCSIFCFLWRQ